MPDLVPVIQRQAEQLKAEPPEHLLVEVRLLTFTLDGSSAIGF
jgi:hypothetical protein